MKKLIVIAMVSMMASFQAFAEAGIACNTADARCSAYELDVNGEVLASFDFTQVQALNLGQVTKSEVVSVPANYDRNPLSRNKAEGQLDVTFSASSETVTVECIAGSSYVNFGNGSNTIFSSCSLEGQAFDASAAVTQELSSASSHILTGGLGTADLALSIGGGITVPALATDGAKTGVLRVEISYQ